MGQHSLTYTTPHLRRRLLLLLNDSLSRLVPGSHPLLHRDNDHAGNNRAKGMQAESNEVLNSTQYSPLPAFALLTSKSAQSGFCSVLHYPCAFSLVPPKEIYWDAKRRVGRPFTSPPILLGSVLARGSEPGIRDRSQHNYYCLWYCRTWLS